MWLPLWKNSHFHFFNSLKIECPCSKRIWRRSPYDFALHGSILLFNCHNKISYFSIFCYQIFDDVLYSARLIASGALACSSDDARIWLRPREPSFHPARILTLGDIDSPQNDCGLFTTDFFHLLIHFLSEAILQVFSGLRFSYIGALNSCKCASYHRKTTHSVLLKSSDFKKCFPWLSPYNFFHFILTYLF